MGCAGNGDGGGGVRAGVPGYLVLLPLAGFIGIGKFFQYGDSAVDGYVQNGGFETDFPRLSPRLLRMYSLYWELPGLPGAMRFPQILSFHHR